MRKDWDKLIVAAPGEHRPPSVEEQAAMDEAVVVKGGGVDAVRSALADARSKRARSLGKTHAHSVAPTA